MNAAKKKLKSGSGATILMALLFFLVAAMVSAVIISAATTAAQTLKARREHQQAYLTCTSAAQYIRDALLQGEDYNYKVVFVQKVRTDWTVIEENKSNDPKDQAKRQDQDILNLIDSLFMAKMGGDDSKTLFTDNNPAEKTVTLQVQDCAPVQVRLSLTREKPEQDSPRTYLLTADCRVEEGSPAQCWVVLKMPCDIQKTEVKASAPGDGLYRRITYQVQWKPDNATIFRDGLKEETQ
mgnify:FL=1